jgi:hypothetical protein
MPRTIALLPICCALILACGPAAEPTLDATDDATLAASLKRMAAGMSPAEKAEFGRSTMLLIFRSAAREAFRPGVAAKPAPSAAETAKPLDGLTAAEINRLAAEARADFAATPDPVDPPPAIGPAPGDPPARPAADPAPPPVVATIGPVTVRVLYARVDTVPLETARGPIRSDEPRLLIALEIVNASPTRKVDYLGWAAPGFALGRDAATLKDELGNTYRRAYFGLGEHVAGQSPAASIYPRKTLPDVLVFEPPVPAAKALTLELPADNVGESGLFRLPVAVDPPGKGPPATIPAPVAPPAIPQAAPLASQPPPVSPLAPGFADSIRKTIEKDRRRRMAAEIRKRGATGRRR